MFSLLFRSIELGDLNDTARILDSSSTDEKSNEKSAVNQIDNTGSTPLIHAIQQQNILMVGLILQYSPDLSICRLKEFGGLSALHLAAKLNLLEISQLLILAKADPNVRSLSGSTPLIEAAMNNSLAVVRFLISIGASTGLTDSTGFSARYYASKLNYPSIACLLPSVYYNVVKQLQSEPKYANQLSGVIQTKKLREKLQNRRIAKLEKKKQIKSW